MVAALALALGALGPCAQSSACTLRVELKEPTLERAAVGALEALGLKRGGDSGVPVLKKLGGDTAFALELDASADPLVVRVRSLHRPASLYGLARVPVARVPERFRQRALDAAVKRGLGEAFVDLQARLAEAAGVGSRRLKLSLQVSGLDRSVREYLVETVRPCLLRQLDLVSGTGAPQEIAGFLEDDLEYAPARDEPREGLAFVTGRLRQALLGGPRSACSVVGSVLDHGRVLVVPDELTHGVMVSIKR